MGIGAIEGLVKAIKWRIICACQKFGAAVNYAFNGALLEIIPEERSHGYA